MRTTKGWDQLENQVKWTNLSPKTPKFEEWGDRGVFSFDSDAIKLPADSAATGAGGMLAFFETELCVVVSSSACGSNSVAAYMALRPGFARPALWGLMGPGAGNAAEATFLKCGEHDIGGAGSAGPTLATYPPLAESLMAASARSGASK